MSKKIALGRFDCEAKQIREENPFIVATWQSHLRSIAFCPYLTIGLAL